MLFADKKKSETAPPLGDSEHFEKNESTLASEDGGVVERAALEKRLVRKLDYRFSILILIYVSSTLYTSQSIQALTSCPADPQVGLPPQTSSAEAELISLCCPFLRPYFLSLSPIFTCLPRA